MPLPLAELDFHGSILPLAVALGIGLMLGVERERRKGRGPSRGPAGIRTFALVALLGGLAERVGHTAVVVVVAAFVGLAAVAAYLQSDRDDPGMTTEVALMVTFLLGVLAQQDMALAAALGVAVALILAHRERFHRIARQTLSEQEIHDGLLMAAAALIVLPLLPDEGLGPNEAFNPLVVWRLVVIVMAVQGAGYVALRVIGPRYGLLVSGFISGFVSSAATVAAMGARAVAEPKLLRSAVGAAVASSVATVVLLAIVVGATSAATLRASAVPLLLAGVAAAGYSAVVAARVLRARPPDHFERGRAFDFKTALILAATISLLLVVAGALNESLGRRGVTLSAAVAGFADSQSAAVSAASLASTGKISAHEAVIPVLAALTTNTVTKAVLAHTVGNRRYAGEVWLGLALLLIAAWGGWALVQVPA
ncbi:MAG: MgtC/SapB family protein, partial [Syntrophothermus sp.]